jgi:hypothetical protein
MYDIKVFSKYAKEGIFKSISYSMLLTLILELIKGIFEVYRLNNFEVKIFISKFIVNFGIDFFDLLFNCLIVVLVALLFTIFMKMIVKYVALYSLTLYVATLPLIIKTILETVNINMNFDTMFIMGTLTYVILVLKYIKDEIIRNLS